jgi:peroxiredoxin
MDPLILNNQIAPDFSLADLSGKCYHLSEWRGSVIILNFWSAECPWAQRADVEIRSYLPAWQDRVLLWNIASNANESAELLTRISAERGLQVVLRDPEHVIADLYGAQTTPHLFVLDAERILRYQGALNDVTFRQRTPIRFYLYDAIEAILAGRQPEPAVTPAYGCTIVRHTI